jgi:S1-C subfamily serine protease
VQINSDLIVLRATDDERSEVTGFPVQTVTGPEPTDLVCLTTLFQERIPQLTVPLSFALPEAGSTVRCFGYPQDAGEKLFPDSLRVVEGVVKAYFPPGFTRGFMRGPCFLVGASVPNGMSGGPVMNEAGAVCGIVSAGAELFLNEAACLVTPLYPSIFLHVAIHAQLASNFRINATRSLIDLCAEGFVTTDGTEDRVHFVEDDEGIEIGPIISMPNGAHVYNSYDDYSRGVSSTPLTEPRMRITVDRAQDGATER